MAVSGARGGWRRWVARVALLAWALQAAAAQECRALDVHVRANSRHNASGHWEVELRLERTSRAPGRGAQQVLFEARPMVSLCGGRRYDAVLITLQGPSPPPGPAYVTVPDVGHYRIHHGPATWVEAKRVCEAESAHLLIINSEAEDKAIQDLLKKETQLSPIVFLGFDDRQLEGNFVTIFGEPLAAVGYQRWHPGQPDGKRTENCGSVFSQTGDLNDQNCESKLGFICEQRIA